MLLVSKLSWSLVRWKTNMKGQSVIILVFCLVSGTLSKPPPTFLEYKDSLGQYSFGYSAPSSARSEVRSLDGSTRGSYSYVDDAGMIQSTQYTADGENGFQVIATNLPQAPSPVVDTPEVTAARLLHLEAHEKAAKLAAEIPEVQGKNKEKIDGKNIDAVVIENVASSVENGISRQAQSQSVNSEEKVEDSAQTQSQPSGVEKEAVMVENEGASLQDQEKPAERKPKEFSSETGTIQQSDVPVVTTFPVIPGQIHLHTKIELDRPAEPTKRLGLESSALPILQSSLLEGSTLDSSVMTPASTKMLILNRNKKGEILTEIASLPAAPMSSEAKDYTPHPYSVRFVPGVVASPNYVAVPYAVGRNVIYPQYNPYHYVPYGIL